MTRYFEVLRRDGPARMGRLLLKRQISTPGIIIPQDYLSVGSVFGYGSLEEAIAAQESLKELKNEKKLAILPYVPSALHLKPTLELPALDLDGPKGVLVYPFSQRTPQDADVYLMGNAEASEIPGTWWRRRSVLGRRSHQIVPFMPLLWPRPPIWPF